jgi:uncharacterized protein YggT (Ycf19 family)
MIHCAIDNKNRKKPGSLNYYYDQTLKTCLTTYTLPSLKNLDFSFITFIMVCQLLKYSRVSLMSQAWVFLAQFQCIVHIVYAIILYRLHVWFNVGLECRVRIYYTLTTYLTPNPLYIFKI